MDHSYRLFWTPIWLRWGTLILILYENNLKENGPYFVKGSYRGQSMHVTTSVLYYQFQKPFMFG